MSAFAPNPGDWGSLIHRALTTETEKIVAEEAAEAGKRVEKRVKNLTAQIVVNVYSQMSFQRIGPDLCITVRFPEDPKP